MITTKHNANGRFTYIVVALAVIGGGLIQPTGDAEAQSRADSVMAPRFGANISLGLGGELELDTDYYQQDDDAVATVGVEAFADFPLHHNFTLGGFTRFQSFNGEYASDNNIDRSTALAFGVVPRARLPISVGSGTIEVHGSLPIGMTVAFLSDDAARNLGGNDASAGIGFTIGVLAGADYYVDGHHGVRLQLGYVYHSYNSEVSNTDGTLSGGQFALNLGYTYAL